MNNFSIKDLLFQDNNVEIIKEERTVEGEKVIHELYCKSKTYVLPDSCPKCGCVGEFEKKGYYRRKMIDEPIRNENVIIYYDQLRVRCKVCKGSTNEILTIANKSSRITNNLKNNILKEIKREHSFKDISNYNNVSITSVENIFEKNIKVDRLELSEALCFDEFKGPADSGKYPFIIVNPYTSDIIDIVLSRNQNYLFNYFSNIPIKERENVKYVVTDLTFNYLNVIKNCFPKAIHIADRFHWIRIIINAVQKIRITAMKFHLESAKREAEVNMYNKKYYNSALLNTTHYKMYYTLKHNYRLLSYNVFDNTYHNLLQNNNHLYKESEKKSNQEILEYMINGDKDLDEAYTLLQELNVIAYSATITTADKLLNDWIKKVESSTKHIEPLKNAINTIKLWKKQIINSFLIDENKIGLVSNGCCEAKNNTVKSIVKSGYGYKKPTLLKNIVLAADRERAERNRKEKEKKYNNYINKNKKMRNL